LIARFFTHLFPARFSSDTLSFGKTLYAGTILVTLFILLGVTGMLLLFYYSPDSASSYSSVIFLEEKVAGGRFIRALHRMCSHVFLVAAALHLLRTVFTGVSRYRKTNWKLGYIIFFIIIFEAYTGYLMPLDQLSFWATKTGMELMNTLPFGDFIKKLLMPDDVGGRLTMLRFFALHAVILPVVSFTLVFAHLYNIRRDGGLVPYCKNAEKLGREKLVRFSTVTGAVTVIAVCILAYIFKSPLDIAADPASPPNPAKSAWFLLWIQEVVSWRAVYFNVVMLLIAGVYFLPDIRCCAESERSVWFDKKYARVWGAVLVLTAAVVILTVIAMFFRGENWQFVSFYF
jgi:quinol-cytochrome oxidoreductase complex cytochrome b subunit